MIVYYSLLAWMVFVWLLTDQFVPRQRRIVQFILCAIPAVLVAAFRDVSVGTDTMQYVNAVQLMDASGFESYMTLGGMYADYEPGFIALLRLCSLFPNPESALLKISSVLIVGIQFYAAFKICERPAIAYIIMFLGTQYYFDLTGMRQAIAAAFALLAVVFALQKKRICIIATLLISVSFHYTAAVIIPVFLLSDIQMTRKAIIWALVGAIVVFLVGPLLPILFTLIGKYQGYLVSGQTYLISGRIMPFIQVVFFGCMLFCFTRINIQQCERRRDKTLVNMGLIASLLGVYIGVSALYINLFYRFMYIIIPIIAVSLPAAFPKHASQSQFIPKITAYIACIVLFISFFFVDVTWFGIDPYALMK